MSRKPTRSRKDARTQSEELNFAPSRLGDVALNRRDSSKPVTRRATSPEGAKETELPEGWRMRRLGDMIERPQYGLTASATNDPHGPRFLRITDIQESGVNWSTVPSCACDQETFE